MTKIILIATFFVVLNGIHGVQHSKNKYIDCPDEGVFFYPHESDCSLFYECADGYLYLFECPAGLHFNPAAGICDYPEIAGCEVLTTDIATELPTAEVTTLGYETTSRLTSYSQTTGFQTSEDLTFSYPQTTVYPTSVELATLQGFCTSDGIYPDTTDCSKFYQCKNGVSYEFQCPGGLFFDPNIDGCGDPSNVDCPNA